MNHFKFIFQYSLVALVLFWGLSHQVLQANTQKPNIVIFYIDDLGYGDVSYQGCQDFQTPAIDSIAANGASFSAGYVTAPVCGPSRAGLLTGRYQQEFGFEDNPGPFSQEKNTRIGIPLSVPTMGEIFKKAGYRTAWIGKHHSGHRKDNHPKARGFDIFYGFIDGSTNYYPSNKKNQGIMEGTQFTPKNNRYLTDLFSDRAIEFIENNSSNPFLLYLPYNGVHTPLEAPPELIAKYAHIENLKRRTLAAMTHSVDQNIARVMNKIEELGKRDNTLVFCISDNGGAEDKSNYSYNGQLRSLKSSMYEGGLRVPFAMQWPDQLKPHGVCDTAVSTLDVLPTIMNAAGIMINPEFPGMDLVAHLNSKSHQQVDRYLYWRFLYGHAIRDSEWKLVKPWGGKDFSKGNDWELYHILSDPGESMNVAEHHPKAFNRLKLAWEQWSSTVMKPQWGWQPDLCGNHHRQEFLDH
ncbi:MAG: sulfatase-like hydrolase/transferase [Planctomycetes bacterium]|nr:sulfatase-like hydrolase/transferase [Planctomycetota bacterium]